MNYVDIWRGNVYYEEYDVILRIVNRFVFWLIFSGNMDLLRKKFGF